jgi:hypothetical protein
MCGPPPVPASLRHPRSTGRLRLRQMRLTPLALLMALAACEHTGPATAAEPGPDEPFAPGTPLRLTYSVGGGDRNPQWSKSGGEFIYAYPRDLNQFDMSLWCVGALPVSGGSRRREYCDTDAAARDTTSMSTAWPAEAPDGRVIFERRRTRRFASFPFLSDLVLRDAPAGLGNVSILPIPFFANGKSQGAITHPAWLDRERIIFVARGVVFNSDDSVSSGQEIFEFSIADGLTGLTPVPGTTWASSLDLDPSGDTLYYTLGGDSLVYQRVLSTGAIDTIANFGSLGIVRDARVRAGKLVAIVGGAVGWGSHPSLGMAQSDAGGPIYAMALPAGTPTLVTFSTDQYQHLAVSPDGEYVVASRFGDLWRLTLP